jgi:hypothetical protein
VVATATATDTTYAVAGPPRPPATSVDGRARRRAVVAWAAVVVVALAWGTWAVADSGSALRAAPLYGRWRWHPGWGLVPAAVLAGAVVAWGPAVASRLRWRLVPLVTGLAIAVWTVALAAAGGWSRLTAPLTSRHEYEPFAADVDDLGAFLGHFTERLGDYPIHVQGHPPGPVALAGLLDRVGLAGAGWLAAVAVAGWAVAGVAALVAVRALAGEDTARRAAPALVLLPAAVWAGTSLDGLFAGIAASGLALAALAAIRSSRSHALGAGVVLGVALLFSYGTVLFVAMAGVVVVIVVARGRGRAVRLLGPLAAGLLAPLSLAAAFTGFWWIDGLDATRHAYWSGVGGDRPAAYLTLVGNPAALALTTGPAVAAGLATTLTAANRRDWQARLLPAVALAALVAANLSQMSRGEVERIWLPFVPLLALAAPGDRRGWLAAQAGLALLLQAALVSPW